MVRPQQIPSCGLELIGLNASAFIGPLQVAVDAIGYRSSPGHIAIPTHHGMCASVLECFLGIETRMNASKDDPGSAFARHAANGVAAQRICCMDSDTHDAAWMYPADIQWLQRLVAQFGIAKRGCRSAGQDK